MLDDTAAAPEAPVADTPAPAPESAPAKPDRVEDLNAKEAAEKALDDDLRKAFRNSKRERSEDGKFAPKDGTIAPPKAKEAPPAPQAEAKDAKPVESKTDQQPEAGKVEPAKPQPPAIDAPASWSAEMKAKWAALPSEAQQYVAQREQEAHARISQLGQYAKQMEPIHKAISEHSSYIQQVGKPTAQFVSELFNAAQALDRDPVSALKELARVYRVDPFTLIDDGTQTQQPSPEVASLQRDIAQLRAQQQQWDNERQQQVKAAEEAKLNALYSEVDQFAKDKPDWSTLQADIIANVAAIREAKPQASNAEVLQDAYDRARWANPVTRAKMQQELQAQADAKRIEEAKKAAASATTANKLNVGGSRPTQSAPADIDSDLRAIWRKNRA